MSNHLASLNDTKTIYSLEDAMQMWEADYVPKYNEYIQAKRDAEKAKERRGR